ncbi:2'-5' RNA ligase family protein [Camelliibacillus cellulosilyticus]|uniref:Putative phosphoesterase ACFO4N_15665 n=1 Tax=Camelliibacillus cellulosilyticus TaxID=2174486 RepID=A0ABV9GSC1_9BACL
MRYGIAIFLSEELRKKVNSYRKRYDSHFAWIPPHITVKEPFELEADEVDGCVDAIRQVTNSIEPIHISVNKVGSFHPVNNVIYLRVADDPHLLELNRRLNQGEFSDSHKYKYVPHITIAQDLSDIEHADVLNRLKMKEFSHEEVATKVHLLKQQENGTWHVYETFYLGKV